MARILIFLIVVLLLALIVSASSGRQIAIENGCNKEIRVMLTVLNNDGAWRDYGWYTYGPCEEPSPLEHDGLRLETDNSVIYCYAETTDGTHTWSGNDNVVNFKGRRLHQRGQEWDVYRGVFYKKLWSEDHPCRQAPTCDGDECPTMTIGKGGFMEG